MVWRIKREEFLRNPFIMPYSATALPFLIFAMLLSSSLRVMSLFSISARIWMGSDVVLDTLYAVSMFLIVSLGSAFC